MEKDLFSKKEYYGQLLLEYSSLLTETTRRRMESFYLEDYSISEISENEKVSRNAVFESIRQGVKALDKYEKKLNLSKKRETLNKYLELLEKEDDREKRKILISKIQGE